MKKQCYPFELFPLPYAYDALEPHIDALTMKLHHDRHLKTYTDNLNKTLAPYPELHSWSLERLLCNLDGAPSTIRDEVKNNAGGVYNHVFYFSGMAPVSRGGGSAPRGELLCKINRDFGNWDGFKAKFKACALAVFGSGYAWLVADKSGRLKIIRLANQDSPITRGFTPLMALDVWEHAYYLKHYNDRASYIDDWFSVVNTRFAEGELGEC